RQNRCVVAARLKSGERIEATHFVNAAGAWAKEICTMLDFKVPIEPLRRFEHYFESEEPIEPLPYLKDRLAFRPEGKGYSGECRHSRSRGATILRSTTTTSRMSSGLLLRTDSLSLKRPSARTRFPALRPE